MKIGIRDGVGCAPERLPAEKRNLTIVPDDFQHEQTGTCRNSRGQIPRPCIRHMSAAANYVTYFTDRTANKWTP